MFGFKAFAEAPISAEKEQAQSIVTNVGAIGVSAIGVYAIGRVTETTEAVSSVDASASATLPSISLTAPSASAGITATATASIPSISVSAPEATSTGNALIAVNPQLATQTFTVTVSNDGSGNKYYIDGTKQASLSLHEEGVYTFDVSDSSLSGHPFKFSTTSDGTHNSGSEYTTNVTTVGTAGSAGAYVQIEVATSTPDLYYYCGNHSGMGGSIAFAVEPLLSPFILASTSPAPTATADATATASGVTISVGSPLVYETVVEVVLDTPSVTITTPSVDVFIGTVSTNATRTLTQLDRYDQSVAFDLEDPTGLTIEKRWVMQELTNNRNSGGTYTKGTINSEFLAAYLSTGTNLTDTHLGFYTVDAYGDLVSSVLNPPSDYSQNKLFYFWDNSGEYSVNGTFFDGFSLYTPIIYATLNTATDQLRLGRTSFNVFYSPSNGNLDVSTSYTGNPSKFVPEDSNGDYLENVSFYSFTQDGYTCDGAVLFVGVYDNRSVEPYVVYSINHNGTYKLLIVNEDQSVNDTITTGASNVKTEWVKFVDGTYTNSATEDAGISGSYSEIDGPFDNQGNMSQRLSYTNQCFDLDAYSIISPLTPTTVTVGSPEGSKQENATASPSLVTVAVSSPAPSVGGSVSVSASPGTVSVSSPASTVLVASTASSSLPTITVGSPLVYETVVEVPLQTPAVSVSSPSATASANASASASLVVVTVVDPTVSASGSSVASSTLVSISVSPAQPLASVSVTASASIPSVTVTAPTTGEEVVDLVSLPEITLTPAEASVTGGATAFYALVLIDAAAPTSTATADSTASSTLPTISVSSPTATPEVDSTASSSLPTVSVTVPTARVELDTATDDIDGTSTVTGTAGLINPASLSISGSSTVSGSVTLSNAVTASITSSATTSSSASLILPSTSSSTGQATTTGSGTRIQESSVSITGSTNVSASCTIVKDADSVVTVSSTVSGTVTLQNSVGGQSSSSATTSGSIGKLLGFGNTTITGSATVSADAFVTTPLIADDISPLRTITISADIPRVTVIAQDYIALVKVFPELPRRIRIYV